MKIEVHCTVCGRSFFVNLPEEVWRLIQELRPNTKHVCDNCGVEDMFKNLVEDKKP